jgi:uncharacterized protein (TIGR03435 family)
MASGMLWVLAAIFFAFVFGQAPAPVKAGQHAPHLHWTKVVASVSGSGGPQNLFGQTTVLLFLPLVSHNEQTLSIWNKLVDKFADKPVNFIWIAKEEEGSVIAFLKSHPVRGWMVLDPQEDSYKAYGIEGADGVLIDSHGTVIGFTSGPPQQDQIQAVLDGRAVAIEGEPTEEQLDAFFEEKAVRLEAEPFRLPPFPEKPNLPPPSDEVHISLSKAEGTISSTGQDYWLRCGFDLRTILSEVLETNPSRIVLPTALNKGTRYDFVLVPPREEDAETMNRQIRAGIEKFFHVTITPVTQATDVYVMTALEGKTPPRKSDEESFANIGGMSFSTEWREEFKPPEGKPPTRKEMEEAARRWMNSPEFKEAMATAQLTGMTALSNSMDEFRRALEDGLHRPIVDETGMTGAYDFKVGGEARTIEAFLNMLRDQLGLVLTPTQRMVDMIVVRDKTLGSH